MATQTMEPVSMKLRPEEKQMFLGTCKNICTFPSNALRMFVSAFNRRAPLPPPLFFST